MLEIPKFPIEKPPVEIPLNGTGKISLDAILFIIGLGLIIVMIYLILKNISMAEKN